MRSTRIILAVWSFGGLLMAENPDPFAPYRQVVDSQLSAMLNHRQVFPPEVREAVPIPQGASVEPNQNSEAEMKTFAERYWGGRKTGFAAAFARLERLRPALESILRAEGVPKELVAVVLVESGAQPLALSPRQAVASGNSSPARPDGMG
jgi:hypothetical protein